MTWVTLTVTLLLALRFSTGQEICSDGERYSPHPECKFYWDCHSGAEPVLRECPADLFWDTRITACNLPENVPECVGGTRLVDVQINKQFKKISKFYGIQII